MRRMKTALVGAGSAVLLVTAGTLTAGAAQPGGAGPEGSAAKVVGVKSWGDCPKGAVCFWTKENGKGTRHDQYVDTNNNFAHASSRFNNGDTSSAYDHVKFKWHWTGQSTDHWTCMKPGKKASGSDYTVDAVRWVKSC